MSKAYGNRPAYQPSQQVRDEVTGWAGEFELHHEDDCGHSVAPGDPEGVWSAYFGGDWSGDSNQDLGQVKGYVEGRITEMAERLGVYCVTVDWVEHNDHGEVWYTVEVSFGDDDDDEDRS